MSIETDIKCLTNFRYDSNNIFESNPVDLPPISDQVY